MTIFIILGLLFVLAFLVFFYKKHPSPPESEPEAEIPVKKQSSQPKHHAKPAPKHHKPQNVKHKELIDSFKHFQANVVDFDMKPNYLAVCCEDSSVIVFKLSSYIDTKAKYVRGALPSTLPSALALHSSGSTVYVAGHDMKIHVFNIHHKDSKFVMDYEKSFPKKHFMKITSVAFTPTCLVTCAEDDDIHINVWSHSGDLLMSHENKQLRHRRLAISRDHKFFSVVTWLGSAKVFEFLKEKKTEIFKGVHVVMELGGHSQGLSAVGFNCDSTLAVTCSYDLTVKLWNIHVQYEYKEHPVLLKNLKVNAPVSSCALTNSRLVLASENNICVYSVPNLEVVNVIENAHTMSIGKLEVFDNILVSGSGDVRINLWQLDN